MTKPTFDEDDQGVPLKQLLPIFTADYDPEGSVDDDETSADRARPTLKNPAPTDYSERVPGESELRAHDDAKPSDLSLEAQLSQFLREPGDDDSDDGIEFLDLECEYRATKARHREARIQTNIDKYRLEHPEAAPDA